MAIDLNSKLKSIESDIKKVNIKIDEHIGGYGTAVHSVAGNGQPGFIPADDLIFLDQVYRTRKIITSDADLKALDPGSYIATGLTDEPYNLDSHINKDTLVLIDIVPYRLGRKRIILTSAYTANTFIKTIHTNGATTGWHQLATETLAFDGKVTLNVGDKLTLSDSIKTMSPTKITIMGSTPSYNYFCETVPWTFGEVTINRNNSANDATNSSIASYEASFAFDVENVTLKNSLGIVLIGGELHQIPNDVWNIYRVYVS